MPSPADDSVLLYSGSLRVPVSPSATLYGSIEIEYGTWVTGPSLIDAPAWSPVTLFEGMEGFAVGFTSEGARTVLRNSFNGYEEGIEQMPFYTYLDGEPGRARRSVRRDEVRGRAPPARPRPRARPARALPPPRLPLRSRRRPAEAPPRRRPRRRAPRAVRDDAGRGYTA